MAEEEVLPPGPEAYANFIQEERDWCAKNREKYEGMRTTMPEQAFGILRQIALKIGQCSADTSAEKSHFTMGQCRQVMAGWDRELGLIEKFERAEKRIKKWDIEEAAKG